jgi:hypothetical protein
MPKIILNSLYSRLFASVSDRSPNIRDRSPNFRDHSPNFRDHSPNFRDHLPNFRDHSPNFRDRSLNIRPHIPAARRGFFYFWPPAAHKKNVNF